MRELSPTARFVWDEMYFLHWCGPSGALEFGGPSGTAWGACGGRHVGFAKACGVRVCMWGSGEGEE